MKTEEIKRLMTLLENGKIMCMNDVYDCLEALLASREEVRELKDELQEARELIGNISGETHLARKYRKALEKITNLNQERCKIQCEEMKDIAEQALKEER